MNAPERIEATQDLETTSLRDKSILVTGGGRGLGAAICETLARAGAQVFVGERSPDLAEQSARRLRDEGLSADAVVMDVGREGDVNAAIRRLVDRFGRIDAVINNAAIDVTAAIDEITVEQYENVVRTNLIGPFLVMKAVVPYMKERKQGHIVNVASTASKRTWPNASAYHSTKWGLLGLSHAMHAELRPHGIKVSAVLPGGMRTPFLLDRFPDIDPNVLQDPANVALAVKWVLMMPAESVIPEMMVIPMRESSWP
ncbi:MAG TPA: SDR family oxidoreductase [Usitatibacter sp.]|jgi:NAD(P)-dependent dehydrogenase (short-subunit alcohol dehydrogenase family)|nr:SDR family oxidoreductase [Usitatibacter sp.]